MNRIIKQSVARIIVLTCVIAAVYVFVKARLNEIYREGIKRDNELSFIKRRNEDLEAKVQKLKGKQDNDYWYFLKKSRKLSYS